MQFSYNPWVIDRIRSILIVMEEGSINKAATRLGIAQPTLTRHLQSLEAEVGAPLFDRETRGVRPTDLAYGLREAMFPVIKNYDQAWADLKAHAQGRQTQLRVGYLGLSAARYLTPILKRFRNSHPDIQLWLFDQTPEEQLDALRQGKLDLALIGQDGAQLGDEFYRQRIARIGVIAALPSDHPLADRDTTSLSELSGRGFIVPTEAAVPGRKKWVARLCREEGFNPLWVAGTEAVAETFARIVGEGCVCLIPDYLDEAPPPGVAYVRLSDRFATWEFVLLRQRGRMSPACRDLIRWIKETAKSPSSASE